MSLPPLNAIKAFEAAGRLENFSKAAAELNVTHSAVSQQIRGLEEQLGFDLFERRGLDQLDAGIRRSCHKGSAGTHIAQHVADD